MGQQIRSSRYSPEQFAEFQQRLRKETAILLRWFHDGAFDDGEDYTLGLELETWLTDASGRPIPRNSDFLQALKDPNVVPELSRFNAEINATPVTAGPGCLDAIADEIRHTWSRVQATMRDLDGRMIMIGTLPTLADSDLTLGNLSDFERYRALNEQVMHMRADRPLRLAIDGCEHLDSVHQDIMLEAATTSFQVHLKPPLRLVTRYFNASMAASAATVAAGANSPYLFGKDLWAESRIPVFEQAVDLPGFMHLDGSLQRRVTFGGDYVRNSLMELFIENLDGYPVLLPNLFDRQPEWLTHVRFHNGTIWRWNRPILGISSEGRPHLRVEHRVMGAGPTVADVTANLAFAVGLVHALATAPQAPEAHLPFAAARANFYAAARSGLAAEVTWYDGARTTLGSLIASELLPLARRGLADLGVSPAEISLYLDDILGQRVRGRRTGADWQRHWVACHGRDFKALVRDYGRHQDSGRPVHEWPV